MALANLRYIDALNNNKNGCSIFVTGMYEETVMQPLPYKAFGFVSPMEFVTKKMPDVARIT